MYYEAEMTTGGSFEAGTLAELAEKIINHYASNGGWAENNCPQVERLLVWGEECEAASLLEVRTLDGLLRTGWNDTVRQIQNEIDHEKQECTYG